MKTTNSEINSHSLVLSSPKSPHQPRSPVRPRLPTPPTPPTPPETRWVVEDDSRAKKNRKTS